MSRKLLQSGERNLGNMGEGIFDNGFYERNVPVIEEHFDYFLELWAERKSKTPQECLDWFALQQGSGSNFSFSITESLLHYFYIYTFIDPAEEIKKLEEEIV